MPISLKLGFFAKIVIDFLAAKGVLALPCTLQVVMRFDY